MTHIASLTLTAFRNYEATSIDGLENNFIVLIGENGAGKTNCMEAISILSPGRGLRGATVMECQSQSVKTPWAVSASIIDKDGDATRLGVGRDPQKPDKKIVRADGDTLKNQQELGDVLRTIWLTPQMDGLFLQGGSERRRFFDRLVASFDPAHTGRMTRYEKAMRDRLTLLKAEAEAGNTADPTWLAALESIMAETSVAIAAARIETRNRLQYVINHATLSEFPSAIIDLSGEVEEALSKRTALSVEDMVRDRLINIRKADGHTGRTNFGVQRTDMAVTYNEKNVGAAQCSTGEQKALLTTIILAHARMVAARYGAPPLLLFDEVAAHFDKKRRDALFDVLKAFKTQIWLSGQDKDQFTNLDNNRLLHIRDNVIL